MNPPYFGGECYSRDSRPLALYNYYDATVTATGSTANRKRFTVASQTLGEDDVLTLGGNNITLNSGTISDTVRGGTSQAASLVLSGISAVAVTIAS